MTLSKASKEAVFSCASSKFHESLLIGGMQHFPLIGLIDDHAHRRGIEPVAGVALLRAVRHRHQQVHFCSEIVEVAGAAGRLFDFHRSITLDLHPHERDEGVGNLSPVEPVGSERHGEVVAAVARPGDAVADAVQLLAAHGAVGVAFLRWSSQ